MECTLHRFAKTSILLPVTQTTPILRVDAIPHIPVECRKGPVLHSLHMPVLDRIEMQVIRVVLIIPVIADSMLPETAPPEGRFVAAAFAITYPLLTMHGRAAALADKALDHRPAFAEVCVTLRQGVKG